MYIKYLTLWQKKTAPLCCLRGPYTDKLSSDDCIESGPNVWENSPPHTLDWTLRVEPAGQVCIIRWVFTWPVPAPVKRKSSLRSHITSSSCDPVRTTQGPEFLVSFFMCVVPLLSILWFPGGKSSSHKTPCPSEVLEEGSGSVRWSLPCSKVAARWRSFLTDWPCDSGATTQMAIPCSSLPPLCHPGTAHTT